MSGVNVKGRASLLALCDALADGCRSELELWGLRRVFRDNPRFAHGIRQLPGSRLERRTSTWPSYPSGWPSSSTGRPITLRHSIENETCVVTPALSALGWVVLRFSYQRLHMDPDGASDEVAAVLQMRRRQLVA
jgi:hypothetical protein